MSLRSLVVQNLTLFAVDYKTFLTILNRPDGFKPAGTPGNISSNREESDTQIYLFLQRSSFVGSKCLTRRATDSLAPANYGMC